MYLYRHNSYQRTDLMIAILNDLQHIPHQLSSSLLAYHIDHDHSVSSCLQHRYSILSNLCLQDPQADQSYVLMGLPI